jgi:acetylornithine deacetylase/succinyl-diaminopimelate desuccinylase-like protein
MAKWHEHVTGKPPEVSAKPRIGAVGDGNLYGATGIPTILYGPGDIDIFEQWPTPNERVLIEDIVVAAKTMALTAVEMCGVDTG